MNRSIFLKWKAPNYQNTLFEKNARGYWQHKPVHRSGFRREKEQLQISWKTIANLFF